jgi:DNA primase
VARIKDTSVEEVRAAVDMVELVGDRTQLRKAGARYSGRCPFHEEKTPSFSVNPSDKLFYCFGCNKGGDAIAFVRELENLDFVGAIEFLADRFRVQLEYEEEDAKQQAQRGRRERLLALLEQATVFYERYLWDTDAGESARAYLASRGLGDDIAKEFRLGLAPLSPQLAKKAREKGFTVDELRATGLVSPRGTDYFSGRLLFPLADARGRVVGFQARKLREDDPLRGKYVNTPESELFHKGSVLYGLHLGRNAVAKEDRAVVVEGNTDVIALRQAGVLPVVASMGTALTEKQLKELSRLTRRLYLCFDGDAAGQDATLRGMELALSQGFDVRVVALPPGVDPADEPEGFERRLAQAASFPVHRVRIELDRAPDKQEAFVRVREILQRFEDSPEVHDAVRIAADRLDLPRDLQEGLLPRRRSGTGTVSRRVLEAGDRLERDALAACVANPSLVKLLAEMTPEHFDAELSRRMQAALVVGHAEDDLVPLRAELDARAAREALDERTGKELLLRLRERRLRRELDAAEPADTRAIQVTLARVREAIAELV